MECEFCGIDMELTIDKKCPTCKPEQGVVFKTIASQGNRNARVPSLPAGCITETLNDTKMVDVIIRYYYKVKGRNVTETAWAKDPRGFSLLILTFGDE